MPTKMSVKQKRHLKKQKRKITTRRKAPLMMGCFSLIKARGVVFLIKVCDFYGHEKI